MITPNKSNIAIEMIEKKKVTDSGIILSSGDPLEVNKGLVYSVGSQVKEIKVGDIVLPNWNSNIGKVQHDDKELWIIPEKEVVGVFTE